MRFKLSVSGTSVKPRKRKIRSIVELLEMRRLLSAVLAGWDASGLAGTTASPFVAQTVDAGLDVAPGLLRDTGLTATSLTKGYASNNWTINGTAVNGAASAADLYVDLKVKANYSLSLSELDLNYRSTSTGPKNAELDYSLDGGATFIPISTAIGGANFTNNSTGQTIAPVDLSGVAALQNLSAGTTVRLRIVPYGGTAATGTFAVYDTAAGNDLAILGTSVFAGGPGSPSIGSFNIAPSPVSVGGAATLTAAGVEEVGGTGSITGVEFFLESNGTPGLQIGGDTDVGPGIAEGSTYTLATTGGAAGMYGYYAVVSDSNGNSSAPSSANLEVSSGPSISFSAASFAANEADGTATITVELSSPAAAETTVQYSTSDGSHFADTANPNIDGAALAGRDYTAAAGTLHFAAGDSSKSFIVPLLNVKTFEGTRSLNVTLSAPSGGILGATPTATLAIIDNAGSASNGVDLPTSTPSYSAELTLTSVAQTNGFMALSPSSTNGFGSGANVGPDMPFLEFSTGSALFPSSYSVSTVDSIKLSLFNTATTGAFGGKPGSFDVYILSNDPDAPLTTPAYRYSSDGATGATVIGNQGSPLLVGSATFTNNVVGFNDFIFDNLSEQVRTLLASSLNAKTPIRFVITPSDSSAVAADWEGNSSFNSGSQKPQLTLIAEKSAAVVENFALDASGVTVNKNGAATFKVIRSGSDLSDSATVSYGTADGSAIAGTDYSAASGTLHFAPNETEQTFTVSIADTPISADKFFLITISNPAPGASGHVAGLAAPATETVVIHDASTTNISQQAGDVATVQPAGPRAAPNGKNFFNIEGSNAAANASFGVLDFNTAGLSFTIPEGQTIGTINSISLGTINAPASFTHSGALDVYLVEDATTDISSNNTALHFDTTDAIEGLNGQLGTKYLLGSFSFISNQPNGTYTDVTLTNLDAAGVNILKSALIGGDKFRIVITPEDPAVAATYAGTSFGVVDGVSNSYQAPRLTINYTNTVDQTPPTVTTSSFEFAAHPQTFTVHFSEDVSASLTSLPILVTNQDDNSPVSYMPTYDLVTNTATLTFAGGLADGNYRVTIPTAVKDAAGNALTAAVASDFFVLRGDVDRDRSVGFSDLVAVAQNYGKTGQSYSSGDLDGDGSVGFTDLVQVAQNYGKMLAPPAAAAPASAGQITATEASAAVMISNTPRKPLPVTSQTSAPVSPPLSPFGNTRVAWPVRKKDGLLY